jgi:hypothetical protein
LPTRTPDYSDQNPFAFEVEVKENQALKGALTNAEKAYMAFGRGIKRVVKWLKDQEKAHDETGKKTKKNAKELRGLSQLTEAYYKGEIKSMRAARAEYRRYEKDQRKREKIEQRIKRPTSIYARLKKSADAAGFSLKRMLGFLGGASIVGTVIGSAKAYLAWQEQILELKSTLGGQPRLFSAASDAVQKYTGYLGMSRGELVSITKQIGELHLVSEKLPNAGKLFRELTLDVIHLSKSMDVSSGSVVDLFDSFLKVYGLPHHRIRGLAASMKFVQEQTGMSGQELISFGKRLDSVLARMRFATKDAKASAVRDLFALTGTLKKFGVDSEAIPSVFSEAMKIDSDRGNDWLAFIQTRTGVGMEKVRKMIEKGDTVTPFSLFIKALKKEGPEALRLNESYYTSMTGMSFAQLTRLMKVNEKSLKGMVDATAKADKLGKLHAKRAQERQHRLSTLWNGFKRVFEKLWLSIGKVVVAASTKLAEFLIPRVGKAVEWLTNKFNWFMSDRGSSEVRKTLASIWDWFNKLGAGASWVADKVKMAISWWQGLSTETKTLVIAGGGLLLLFGKLGPIIGALGGKVATVAAGLLALYAGAKKVANWVDEQQTKKRAAKALAAGTQRAIDLGLGENKSAQISFVKGQMFGSEAKAGKTLLTTAGKINDEELWRRAAAILPTWPGQDVLDKNGFRVVLLNRKRLVDKWKTQLSTILSFTDMKEVRQSMERQRKLAEATSPKTSAAVPASAATVAKTAPTPPTPVPASPLTPAQVVAVHSSPTTDGLLGEIRDLLKRMASGGPSAPVHPSRTAINNALGGGG